MCNSRVRKFEILRKYLTRTSKARSLSRALACRVVSAFRALSASDTLDVLATLTAARAYVLFRFPIEGLHQIDRVMASCCYSLAYHVPFCVVLCCASWTSLCRSGRRLRVSSRDTSHWLLESVFFVECNVVGRRTAVHTSPCIPGLVWYYGHWKTDKLLGFDDDRSNNPPTCNHGQLW